MNVLSVEDLRISYRSRGEWREVVHNVSFSIQRGEMLAFVGESGSGKTTTAQAIIGLLADNARRDAGRIILNGEVISDWSAKRLNRLRGVSISLVPQDPGNSLNPVKTIGQQVEEILQLHQSLSAAERRQQARMDVQDPVAVAPEGQRPQAPQVPREDHQFDAGALQRRAKRCVGRLRIGLGRDDQGRHAARRRKLQRPRVLVVANHQPRLGGQLPRADRLDHRPHAGAISRRQEAKLKRRKTHQKSPLS